MLWVCCTSLGAPRASRALAVPASCLSGRACSQRSEQSTSSTLGKLLGLRAPSVWFEEASDYGLASSLEYIQALVAQEVKRGIAPDRIVIAGAGQGGDVAVLTGLLLTARLGGVVSLAAHLPQTIALLPSPESAATPFLCWVPPQDLDAAEAADTLLALVRPACSPQPLSLPSI